MVRGYGLLFIAFSLLVGPTMILACLRKPQIVALKVLEDRPVAYNAYGVQ